MKKLFFLTLGLGLLWTPVGFGAGNTENNITVTATVDASCTVTIDASELNFGTYDSYSTLYGSKNFTVECGHGVGYDMHISTDIANRKITDDGSSTYHLNYSLLNPGVGVTCSGTGSEPDFPDATTAPIHTVGNATPQEWEICGVLADGQSIPVAGYYSQDVTLFIDFGYPY